MSITIQKARSLRDCERVSNIAYEIWMQHYESILTKEQIQYMLEKYQSAAVIYEAIQKDHVYFMALDKKELIGYCGIQYEKDAIFLSKLYIEKRYRGRGIGRAFFEKVKQSAAEYGVKSIWLTVNRGNADTVAVYQKLGFSIDREDVKPIGNGFVKDDYIMKYKVESQEFVLNKEGVSADTIG